MGHEREAKDKGVDYYDTNHKKIQTRAQFRLELWAYHLKSPTAALAKSWKVWNRVRSYHLLRVNGELRSFGLFSSLLLLVRCDEHPPTLRTAGSPPVMKVSTMWKTYFMLCSFGHHACSPLLQEFLHEEELCKVAQTCHFSLDVIFLCQD